MKTEMLSPATPVLPQAPQAGTDGFKWLSDADELFAYLGLDKGKTA